MRDGDAYVAIGRNGRFRKSAPPQGPHPLLFIDVAPDAELRDFREIPHTFVGGARTIIVRDDRSDISVIEHLMAALGSKAVCARLEHPIGKPSILTFREASGTDDKWLIERARSIELQTRLVLGSAVWIPKRYHFLLPSGRHASGFVRLANIVQEPYDARTIARWFLPFVSAGSAIVADSKTLSPILLGLDLEMRRFDAVAGPMVVLDQYPRTRADVCTALADLATDAPLLAILSVSSSGATRDLLEDAVQTLGITTATIVTVVDTQAPIQSAIADATSLHKVTFVSIASGDGPSIRSWDKTCDLCLVAEKAALVPVDTHTFDAQFPSLVQPVMPSVTDPRENRLLWECCHTGKAIDLEATPDSHIAHWRPSGALLPVKFDLTRLLTSAVFVERCAEQLKKAADAWRPEGANADEPWPSMDLVLVPKSDADRPGFSDFWKKVGKRLAAEEALLTVPNSGPWEGSVIERAQKAKRILAFTLGTVTGATLQHMLVTIQDSRNDNVYELFAAIAHARPAYARVWQTLRNSFSNRLVYGWLSFLPDEDSPLQDETRALAWLDGALPDPEDKYLGERLDVCRGLKSDRLFWASTGEQRLSAHSIFGDRLDQLTTYVAVGSAIHRQRVSAPAAPERRLFEVPAILRSYYDPLIICSMFRWFRPHEVVWGTNPVEGESAIQGVLERANSDQQPMLVAELLLAAAQGKVPRNATEVLVTYAAKIIEKGGDRAVPVSLAGRLVEAVRARVS
jgi:hypothetical protein